MPTSWKKSMQKSGMNWQKLSKKIDAPISYNRRGNVFSGYNEALVFQDGFWDTLASLKCAKVRNFYIAGKFS
jgi:hypothetical protein